MGRNQLSVLPPCVCSLPLRVLNASNNKLSSLPEAIGQLSSLMELGGTAGKLTEMLGRQGERTPFSKEKYVRRRRTKNEYFAAGYPDESRVDVGPLLSSSSSRGRGVYGASAPARSPSCRRSFRLKETGFKNRERRGLDFEMKFDRESSSRRRDIGLGRVKCRPVGRSVAGVYLYHGRQVAQWSEPKDPDLSELPLVKFDLSCNKVSTIPPCYRKMAQLQCLQLENNPLQSPPAQICIKGKVHIFKYLSIEACRGDKVPESLYLPAINERFNLLRPAASRTPLVQHTGSRVEVSEGGGAQRARHLSYLQPFGTQSVWLTHNPLLCPSLRSIEDIDQNKKQDTDSGVGSDNGDKRLSTTEPSDEDSLSLSVPMSHITEEEGLSKDDSSEHIGALPVDPRVDAVGLLRSGSTEFGYGDPALSEQFVGYIKASACVRGSTRFPPLPPLCPLAGVT
ncbi:hypothetical protein Z043_118226 [Scleropages formosus]|uniref:Uncharacterized protein n=1 Tax=Scleropages formosus TaxID=113540 RepID=A0A0P7UNN0_SCLFO|nr:hypothetical protein Z043_118226 [Scleropages formosus]